MVPSILPAAVSGAKASQWSGSRWALGVMPPIQHLETKGMMKHNGYSSTLGSFDGDLSKIFIFQLKEPPCSH